MYFLVVLKVSKYDHIAGNLFVRETQSYKETWSVLDYTPEKHSKPEIDTILYHTYPGFFEASIVIESPEYVDDGRLTYKEAFMKGKAAILKSQDLPTKLYFTED